MVGKYKHTVDPKGRLFVPSKLKDELGASFYVTLGLDHCLSVYTEEGWEEHHRGKNDDYLLESVAGRAYALTVVNGELNQNANFRKEIEAGFKILSE